MSSFFLLRRESMYGTLRGMVAMRKRKPRKLPTYTCLRCGHTWVPRRPERPLRCANVHCRSAYWDKPRKSSGS